MGHVEFIRVYMRGNKYNMAKELKERDCLEDLAVDFILTL
jgi:hypothetical protein